MRPTLRQLQYIVAVADTGRFSDAAAACHVSQPSLSAQIADMEGYLGVILAERGRQGATLTPTGVELVSRARQILRAVEDLRSVAQRKSGTLSGKLRLGVLPSIGPYLLPLVVRHLHADYPDFRLALRDESATDLDQNLRSGVLDCIISTAEDHRDMSSRPLFSEQLWICTAGDDPLADKSGPLDLIELKGRTVLSLGTRHRLSYIVHNLADIAGAGIDLEYEGTSLDAIRQMSVMGTGVAILPSLYTLTEARRDAELCLRPIAHPLAKRDISLIWRKASPLEPEFNLLAERLERSASELLGEGT